MKYQHGLAVMRAQPFHIGHHRIVTQMLAQCRQVTVVLGSIQEAGTERNPFDFTVRRRMLLNCFGENRLQIMGLADINNPMRWAEFVLRKVAEIFPDSPRPDVYYAGSDYDAHWFENTVPHIEIVNRNNPDMPFVSATMVRDMIRYGDARWKNFVPAENIALIEQNMATVEVKV